VSDLFHFENLEDLPLAQSRIVDPVLGTEGDPAGQQEVGKLECPQHVQLLFDNPGKVHPTAVF